VSDAAGTIVSTRGDHAPVLSISESTWVETGAKSRRDLGRSWSRTQDPTGSLSPMKGSPIGWSGGLKLVWNRSTIERTFRMKMDGRS